MNAVQSKRREIIEERFMKMHEDVFKQMMNEEKNSYDSEIKLPMCDMQKDILKKKEYDIGNRVDDTPERKKRRENRLNVLEKYIINGNNEEAEKIIEKSYYLSITEVSQQANDSCNEKTARTLIKSMCEIVGYSDINRIPEALKDEIVQFIKEIVSYSKTIYKCCKEPDKILNHMGEEEMLLTYKFYLLIKKIILIKSHNKAEYEKTVESLSQSNKIKAVYAAAKELY